MLIGVIEIGGDRGSTDTRWCGGSRSRRRSSTGRRRQIGASAGMMNACLFLFATLAGLGHGVSAGSCRAAKLCCQGRDSGCVIQKESPNAIIESPRDKPCYCDHACLKLADCCDDFKETCGVVDCTVGEWTSWTVCDNGCGTGTQRRSRQIKSHDRNGGKHCPRLDQVRTCRSFVDCRFGMRPLVHDRSVTLVSLLPAGANCTNVQCKDKDKVVGKSSCVAFTVVRASRACDRVSTSLTEGARICVAGAMTDRLVGIGRWKVSRYGSASAGAMIASMDSSCHGKWIGDPRAEIDCENPRCGFVSRMAETAERTRRASNDDPERTAKRRRRRKRRRRNAGHAVEQ